MAEQNKDLIKAILEKETLKAKNDSKRIELEEKQIEFDFKSAQKTLELQAEIIKKGPSEKRKDIITLGIISTVVLLVILGFVVWSLHEGHKDFLLHLAKIAGYIIIVVMSYVTGYLKGKNHKKSNLEEIDDVEITD